MPWLRKVALAIPRYSRTLVTMNVSPRWAVDLMNAGVATALAELRARHGDRWPDISHDPDTHCWRASRPIEGGTHHIVTRTLDELGNELDNETPE